MSELDGTRTISIPTLSFNYVDNCLESIGTCGELYYRERGACVPYAGTRWHELFGTPERAARTIAKWCAENDGSCAGCPLFMYGVGIKHCEQDEDDMPSLLEWLRGDA